jgi:type VI secretion system protein ImpK
MLGQSAFRPGNAKGINDAHDVTENSLHTLLDGPDGASSPYPASQGKQADQTDGEGYPADPHFQMRGGYANLMIDAAAPLFGLVMRLRTLDELPNIAFVHKTVRSQISTIRAEIEQHGYGNAHLQIYSYALCLYMDEAVMERPWGRNSCWSHESLLSIFHDETNGGEKIFILLQRVMQAPEEFKDVLEFMYFCFALGLKGKYALDPKCDEIINDLIHQMHTVIRALRGPTPEEVCDPYTNVVHCPHRIRREWPWWSPLVISAIAMACAYTYYSYHLGLLTAEVLESLNGILQQ